jgi:predicted nuclease with TOPRIM domain
MKIERALDWTQVSIDLKTQLSKSGYNPDLQRMFRNIETMVSELSKLEVEFRKNNKVSRLDDKVNEINNAISYLEKLILMAYLIK